jgi:hypothetical protein
MLHGKARRCDAAAGIAAIGGAILRARENDAILAPLAQAFPDSRVSTCCLLSCAESIGYDNRGLATQ